MYRSDPPTIIFFSHDIVFDYIVVLAVANVDVDAVVW